METLALPSVLVIIGWIVLTLITRNPVIGALIAIGIVGCAFFL